MYLTSKGKVPRQAHVGIPDGLSEEEHGRDGFAGPVSHLYRNHPPTGWVRIEGPLKPRAFLCRLPASEEPALLRPPLDSKAQPAQARLQPVLHPIDARLVVTP